MTWPVGGFGGVLSAHAKGDMVFAQFLNGENVEHLSFQVKTGEYIPQVVKIGKFVDVLIAPDFDDDAIEFLKRKSKIISTPTILETP